MITLCTFLGFLALFLVSVPVLSVLSHFGRWLLIGPIALCATSIFGTAVQGLKLLEMGLSSDQSPINPYLAGLTALAAALTIANLARLVHLSELRLFMGRACQQPTPNAIRQSRRHETNALPTR